VTSIEERWLEKPPSALTVWLLTAVAVLAIVFGLFVAKGLVRIAAIIALILCTNLAVVAWRTRRRARSR
jgi:uncharacterized membrane protein YphA (DoxX/SURF4 family)